MKDKELRSDMDGLRVQTEMNMDLLLKDIQENQSAKLATDTVNDALFSGIASRIDLLMDYLDVETQDYARKLVKRKKSTPPKNT